ncbi:MAG: hypothetical protein ACRDYZ_08255 [Acidimicrobiales bacterium]
MLSADGRFRLAVSAYPELVAVLAAAALGLSVQRPLTAVVAHHGIDILLVVLVFATALGIEPTELRSAVPSWPVIAAAAVVGVTILPAVAWGLSLLVTPGPLRDGVRAAGLAPCEIASMATAAMAGGAAAVGAGVLVTSTLATILLAGPILGLEAGGGQLDPASIAAHLALVVAMPLALGLALRTRWRPAATAGTAGKVTATVAIAGLVALIAAEVHLGTAYAAVVPVFAALIALSAVIGRLLGGRRVRPVRTALLLTTSMRDFAVAASLAAAAWGPSAAAPLGVYGVLVLAWGTAAAGFLRSRRRAT